MAVVGILGQTGGGTIYATSTGTFYVSNNVFTFSQTGLTFTPRCVSLLWGTYDELSFTLMYSGTGDLNSTASWMVLGRTSAITLSNITVTHGSISFAMTYAGMGAPRTTKYALFGEK